MEAGFVMSDSVSRWTARGIATVLIVGAFAFIALGAGSIVAWDYSNSDRFCTTVCHSVHPEESRAHATSVHANVRCVECHIGRLSTLRMIALKPEHAKELWGMIVGYRRPLVSTTLRPARENCEGCHWPSARQYDSVAVFKHYATDAASSESTTRIVLHTAVGEVRERRARPIHWHIDNEVLFYSPDPQRRVIPWVQVKRPDGTTATYVDATAGPAPEDLKKNPPRRVECFDCHNEVGHPFPHPADEVDQAIALGEIDRSLPSIKARAMALIDKASKLYGEPRQLAPQIDELIAESAPKGELSDDVKAQERKFAAAMERILLASSFTRPELSCKTFPNHTGHKDSPGCFRCHDGRHLNGKGEAIRQQCTLCHDLPQVRVEGGKGSVPSTVMAGLAPPASHDAPNFMRDHYTRIDDACAACHGKLDFGRDGGNFCANPACHGRKYPGLSSPAKS
jgi:hypothetical protein